MNIEELVQFVDVKEGQEDAFIDYLRGKMITPEGVRSYLEKAIASDPTTEERRTVQPFLDKYHSKGLETWKKNHLESIIEEEVSKRNPAETEEQKRIRKLEEKLAQAEQRERQSRLKAFASSLATQKNLPPDIVGFFVGEDESATEANLETLHNIMSDQVEAQVKARFRETGRQPQFSAQSSTTSIDKLREQYNKAVEQNMPLQERVKLSRQIQEAERQKE